MVLLARIELATSPLPRECSTTELQQRVLHGGLVACSSLSGKPFNRRDILFHIFHDVLAPLMKELQ